jgi:hypothetical protein
MICIFADIYINSMKVYKKIRGIHPTHKNSLCGGSVKDIG